MGDLDWPVRQTEKEPMMPERSWTYYAWQGGPSFTETIALVRKWRGVYERWDTRTHSWVSTPGESTSRAIEGGDPTLDKVSEGEARRVLRRLRGVDDDPSASPATRPAAERPPATRWDPRLKTW